MYDRHNVFIIMTPYLYMAHGGEWHRFQPGNPQPCAQNIRLNSGENMAFEVASQEVPFWFKEKAAHG